MIKLSILYAKRFFRSLSKNIGPKISILLLILSVTISFTLIFTNFFHRVPVFSYFVDTMKLPLSYEFSGTIILIDSEGKEIKQNIKISIGGYNITTSSGEIFTLNFSAPKTEYIYLTVILESSNGDETIVTKKVKTDYSTTLREEVIISV